MPHWKSMMDKEFLYAFDLKGRDVTLTIDRVSAGKLKNGKKESKKPLCYFVEPRDKRPLALNATNCKTIAKLYGNDTDEWRGKRITLYPTTTEMAGETVECIRIRPRAPGEKEQPGTIEPAPQAEEPEREPGSDDD